MGVNHLLLQTVDSDNNLYAAAGDKLFKIDQEGRPSVLASDFTCADDVRLDDKGNIYVTDSFENRVYKISPQLEKTVFIDSDTAQNQLNNQWHITGITFDNNYQNLYIARMERGQVVKYPMEADGNAGKPQIIAQDLPEPDHLEIDEKGNLYVTIFRRGSVIRINTDGTQEALSSGKMSLATGIAFGRGGFDERSVYVADYGQNKIYRIYVGEKAVR